MALLLTIDDGKGFTLTYHRISRLEIDTLAGRTWVAVDCFVTEDVRRADGGLGRSADKRYANFDAVPDSEPLSWAYGQLKQLPEWSGAQNA